MRKKDIEIGKYVTCLEPLAIYYSDRLFLPGMVGTITSLGGPRDFLVDFYSREMRHNHEKVWRSSAFARQVKEVSQEKAMAYLMQHAPTWQEHLDKLIAFYNSDYYQCIQRGECAPYTYYEAHTVLVSFLLTKPPQQKLLEWLETYKHTYDYTAGRVKTEASTLQLSNDTDSVRIPWTYRDLNKHEQE